MRRGKKNTYHKTALVHIQGVRDTSSAEFYLGKKVAYIYKVRSALLLACRGPEASRTSC